MKVFILSAYETTAEAFFGALKTQGARLVLDARLRNESQLCGFTKARDLAYFVKTITGADYVHDLAFAPTPELLDAYVKGTLDWPGYAAGYRALLKERKAVARFRRLYAARGTVCLLGAGTKKRHSHVEVLPDLLGA